MKQRKCRECGNTFDVVAYWARYCSPTCASRFRQREYRKRLKAEKKAS